MKDIEVLKNNFIHLFDSGVVFLFKRLRIQTIKNEFIIYPRFNALNIVRIIQLQTLNLIN